MLESNPKAFEGAQKYAHEAGIMVTDYFRFAPGSAESLELDTKIRELVKPGFWEHFKSREGDRKYYQIFDTQEQLNDRTVSHRFHISYASQYGPKAGRKALRELLGPDGFLTPIERPEYTGPRFIYRGTKRPRS